MKVFELIALLERCDKNAHVFMMNQPEMPFEYDLSGVTTRGEVVALERGDETEDPDDRLYSHERFTDRDAKLPQSDVFLCEGPQKRFGSRNAWETGERTNG